MAGPPAPTAWFGLPLPNHVNSWMSPEFDTRSPSEQENGNDTCEFPFLHLRGEKPSPADAFSPVIVDGSRGENTSPADAFGPVIVDGSKGTLALNN
ncbi:hypothetical protein KEM56_003976 [Ascosphaera pollenicola]|nr:hypothetical protein KEM56_003976 [Ascosphaera pollenicola]